MSENKIAHHAWQAILFSDTRGGHFWTFFSENFYGLKTFPRSWRCHTYLWRYILDRHKSPNWRFFVQKSPQWRLFVKNLQIGVFRLKIYVFRLNLNSFLWFIIAQSYNSVARTPRVGKWKLQITCDEKNHAWPSATCDFFHHVWFAILIFQLVRFHQHYIVH